MLGVLGDLGGIFEITMIVFGFFLFPISEHSFTIQAARLLYFARTKEKGLLNEVDDSKENALEKYLDQERYGNLRCSSVSKEINKHRIIRLTRADNIKLFVSNILKSLCLNCCWGKKQKLQKLYQLSEEKIGNSLDILKLIQNN